MGRWVGPGTGLVGCGNGCLLTLYVSMWGLIWTWLVRGTDLSLTQFMAWKISALVRVGSMRLVGKVNRWVADGRLNLEAVDNLTLLQ